MNEEWHTPAQLAEIWGVENVAEQYAERYVVLSLDPGGSTGWCIMGVHPDAMEGDPDVRVFGPYGNVLFWSAGELTGSQDGQIDSIMEMLALWPDARLVTEGFKLHRLDAELSPVEINAAIRWAARPRYWVVQMPSMKDDETDARLKASGFWVPGSVHARDAVRHAKVFLNRQKERAIKAAYRNGKRPS